MSGRIPTKRDLDGNGLAHPARFSNDLIKTFDALLHRHLPDGGRILDPFAGTGRIHELGQPRLVTAERQTVGIEIEPEWAALHPDTIVGDALALPFGDDTFDAIVTSPTYGNRLADSHNATDPERRRSYTHDLGHQLHPHNTGGMQWGDQYRDFHTSAWREAIRVLRPGGLFIVNVKDHIRQGDRQNVTAWHVHTLQDLGLRIVDVEAVWTGGLDAGTNSEARRRLPEFVIVLRGPLDQLLTVEAEERRTLMDLAGKFAK